MRCAASKTRIAQAVLREYSISHWPIKRSAAFLEIAEKLGLGVAARDKIEIAEVALG